MASRKSNKKQSPIDMGNGQPTQRQLKAAYGDKIPAGNRSLGRSGYIKATADVIAEGPWGTGKYVDKAASIYAGKQWDRVFGPKTNKPAKSIRSKKK